MTKPKNSVLVLAVIMILSLSVTHNACTTEATQPSFGGCEKCHPDVAANFTTSLHYTGAGMMGEYARGAAGHFGIDMDSYYTDWNCSKCHVTTCTKCHPGETPYDSHGKEITIDTCDPCHKKKQTATFVGDMPAHKKKGPHADIHYERGLICTDCHSAEELHGDGTVYDHQMAALKTACEDCHTSPGKVVKGMSVTQFAWDIPAHAIHTGKLDCTACHSGWQLNCKNCHLDTRKGTKPVSDEFYLAVAADGLIKPFIKMDAIYNNETHTGYGEWFSHTIADKAKDCAFCHENSEVLCEGAEGQMLGDGGSLISQATIDRILGVDITPPPSPAKKTIPGFSGVLVVVIIGITYLVIHKRE